MAKVPVDLRQLYECDDEGFRLFVSAVVELTIEKREEANESS